MVLHERKDYREARRSGTSLAVTTVSTWGGEKKKKEKMGAEWRVWGWGVGDAC